MTNDEFLADDLDDEKTIEFIKGYLPQDLKEKFSDDELYYFLDVIDDYYANSGILDAKPDDEGFIDIDLDKVVDYVINEAKKDEIGEFEHDDILFVVQGEMEYTDTLEWFFDQQLLKTNGYLPFGVGSR